MARRKGADIEKGTGTESGTGTGTGTGAVKKTGRPKGSKSGYTMSDKALAQRHTYSPIIQATRPYTGEDIDYNARQIQHILHIQEIASTVDKNDPVSLRNAFYQYLALCGQDGFKVGNLAAYSAMGVDRYTVTSWTKSPREEYRELARLVKTTCSLARESMVADQKINPVVGIFWQRNFDGLRNDTEQIQPADGGAGDDDDKATAQEYLKKYGDILKE